MKPIGLSSSTMNKKIKSPEGYLLLVGGINTVNFAFSLVTVYVLNKARNGAIVGVKELLGEITITHLGTFLPILLLVGGSATLLGIKLSKFFAKILEKVSYKALVTSVIIFIILIVLALSHIQGILILIVATALGILANTTGAQKNMLLGCLILPVITYLW